MDEKIKKEGIKLEDFLKDTDIQNAFTLIRGMTFKVEEAEKNVAAKQICAQLEKFMIAKSKEEKKLEDKTK